VRDLLRCGRGGLLTTVQCWGRGYLRDNVRDELLDMIRCGGEGLPARRNCEGRAIKI
jgi:hypothetical protein